MKSIKILQIADLHIRHSSAKEIRKILKHLMLDLNNQNISPDCICICGDITYNGQKSDFELASQIIIEELTTPLNLPLERLVLCPGNHDIDRSQCISALEEDWKNQFINQDSIRVFFDSTTKNAERQVLFNKKIAYETFIQGLLPESVCKKPTRIISNGGMNFGFISVDTTWRSSGFGVDEGRLLIDLDEIKSQIQLLKDNNAQCVIAVAHHPLSMLCHWNAREAGMLFAQNIDLSLTGHLHCGDTEMVKRSKGCCTFSTVNSVWDGRYRCGYSLIEINDTLKINSKKWIPDQYVFSIDTSFGNDGVYHDENFMFKDLAAQKAIDIGRVKHALVSAEHDTDIIVQPFDELKQVTLRDVFVEPIITDQPSKKGVKGKEKQFSIDELIDSSNNIVLVGRKEYGKTTFLRHIYDVLIDSDDPKIPVFIDFRDIPKHNTKGLVTLIIRSFEGHANRTNIESYLSEGNITLLVDDIDDLRDPDVTKKKAILSEFLQTYNKCRLIATMQDSLNAESSDFKASEPYAIKSYFLASFTSTKIRTLLEKWCQYQNFNVDDVLKTTMQFFRQLRLPPTPLAVTLLVSVLLADKKTKQIFNEAYLVENYIETILEKRGDRFGNGDMGFRDKEAFLAHLAKHMYEKNQFGLKVSDFEQLKIDYYNSFDEELPDAKEFDPFFNKGILKRSRGEITFQFRFLFFFFLAKALTKKRELVDSIFSDKKVIAFASALSYKAGLERSDAELLERVSTLIDEQMKKYKEAFDLQTIDARGLEEGLMEYTKDIKQEIESRNTKEHHDNINDLKYLDYDIDDQEIARQKSSNEIAELLALHGDILRNTREITPSLKRKELSRHIDRYRILILDMLDQFKKMISELENPEIQRKLGISAGDEEVKKILKGLNSFMIQAIPTSAVIFIAEHLSNPKLTKSLCGLCETTKDREIVLLYSLIIYILDHKIGNKMIRDWMKKFPASYVLDSIAWTCIRLDGHSRKLTNSDLTLVINLLDILRKRWPCDNKKRPQFLIDTFRSDISKELKKCDSSI